MSRTFLEPPFNAMWRIIGSLARAVVAVVATFAVVAGFTRVGLGRTALAASPNAPATENAAASNESLAREGRSLYRGEIPWRVAPQLHGVAMPDAACVQCHGARGDARTEAGVAVPSIRWQHLTQASTQRGAYTEATLLQALRAGHRPGGPAMLAPMPRYAPDPQEARALIAWLRVMGTDAAPVAGVTRDQITLGSVLPLTGPQAAVGASVRQTLEHEAARINRSGGLFGRRLTLEVADAGADAASANAAALALVQSGRVLALVGAMLPEPDAALRRALAAHETPMIATLGQPASPTPDPYITWLLPSLVQQLAALAKAMPDHCPSARQELRVLHAPSGPLAAVAAAARAGPLAHVPALQWIAIDSDATLSRALAPPARTAAASPLLLLLPSDAVRQARQALGPRGPCVGTLAVVSGSPPQHGGPPELLGLPMQPAPGAGATGGATRTALWTMLSTGAFAVATEAMSRAGRRLDGARLGAAVDSLQGLEPMPGLTLSFAARQRHGLEPIQLWMPP